MSIISIYMHLESYFPRKQHTYSHESPQLPYQYSTQPPEGKPSARTREQSTAASQKSSFREMCSGCTGGFRQKWELGQDLWLRARFYLVHCKVRGCFWHSSSRGKRHSTGSSPQQWGGCSTAWELWSSEAALAQGRRLQSSFEGSTQYQFQIV